MKLFFHQNKIKKRIIIVMALIISFLFQPSFVSANNSSLQKANYFLHWQINDSTARQLAKWDLLILDMETQVTSRRQLDLIKSLNPDIKMLVYITSQEIEKNAPISKSRMRQKLAARIDPRWYAVNTRGQKLSFWPGAHLLNMSTSAPTLEGKKMNKALAEFVAYELLSTGLWDGVFYDNTFDSITWFTGADIDLDLNRKKDNNPDQSWRDGMNFLYDETRRLVGDKYWLVGNGTTRFYRDKLNGQMIENFLPAAWSPTMRTYKYFHEAGPHPRVNILNANTFNQGSQVDYQKMRFGLTSALLVGGYYSFDFGDTDHGQTWYYDEYDADLGGSLGQAVAGDGAKDFEAGVWQRNYEHGLAVVNSSNRTQTVSLGGEYEKIRGTQDTRINDGAIVSEETLAPYDGRVMLKTFATLEDVVFTNGDFVRFLSPDSTKVRNGFFVFEDDYKGGDKIAHVDLDGNGKRDLIALKRNRLYAWRDDGELYMKIFPYGVNFKGEIKIAVGDINADGKKEIVTAPGNGYNAPIKIYSRDGFKLVEEWYPFGTNYKNGYSIALGDVAGNGNDEILIGTGKNSESSINIFKVGGGYSLSRLYRWFGFERSFRGGVNVAAGNVDGVGKDEVIVGAGSGKGPIIKVFEASGKKLYKDITAYKTLLKTGIDVRSADVDFDGTDDIIGLSSGI